MSDFISINFDYAEFIKTDEDRAKFKRMKELEPLMKRPMSECYNQVIEYSQLERSLRGLPPLKIIIQGNPKNN